MFTGQSILEQVPKSSGSFVWQTPAYHTAQFSLHRIRRRYHHLATSR